LNPDGTITLEGLIGGIIKSALAPLQAEVGRLTTEVETMRKALPPAFVTLPEAARVLGLSLSTVRRRVKDGKLPCCHVGRSVRVDLASLKPPTDDQVAGEALRLRTVSDVAG
jgi:excisionase family DNA binding protein